MSINAAKKIKICHSLLYISRKIIIFALVKEIFKKYIRYDN